MEFLAQTVFLLPFSVEHGRGSGFSPRRAGFSFAFKIVFWMDRTGGIFPSVLRTFLRILEAGQPASLKAMIRIML